MSLSDNDSKPNTPERIRTSNLHFRRPMHKKDKNNKNKDLEQAETIAYKPAYKQNGKKQENQPEKLPVDLVEVVAVWPELPGHIKNTILYLVRTVQHDDK